MSMVEKMVLIVVAVVIILIALVYCDGKLKANEEAEDAELRQRRELLRAAVAGSDTAAQELRDGPWKWLRWNDNLVELWNNFAKTKIALPELAATWRTALESDAGADAEKAASDIATKLDERGLYEYGMRTALLASIGLTDQEILDQTQVCIDRYCASLFEAMRPPTNSREAFESFVKFNNGKTYRRYKIQLPEDYNDLVVIYREFPVYADFDHSKLEIVNGAPNRLAARALQTKDRTLALIMLAYARDGHQYQGYGYNHGPQRVTGFEVEHYLVSLLNLFVEESAGRDTTAAQAAADQAKHD